MTLREFAGYVAFWAFWPIWFAYLKGSVRTRVLVVAGRKVLVVKDWHGGGKWALPGGGVHQGESFKKSAVREVYEETNLTLEPQKLKSLGQAETKKGGIPFRIARYGVKVKKAFPLKPKSLEIHQAEWVLIKNLDETNTEPLVLELLNLWKKRP